MPMRARNNYFSLILRLCRPGEEPPGPWCRDWYSAGGAAGDAKAHHHGQHAKRALYIRPADAVPAPPAAGRPPLAFAVKAGIALRTRAARADAAAILHSPED